MNKKNAQLLLVLGLLLLTGNYLLAQTNENEDTSNQPQYISLENVIQLAKEQSTASLWAETQRENRYWEYRVYKSRFNPQLRLSGTFPEFRRSFQSIQTDNGNFEVVLTNYNRASLALSLEQQIGFTGGTVSLRSSLDRFDDLRDGFEFNNPIYNTNPVYIELNQPIFNYNDLLWAKKVEPLLFEESRKEYVEAMEDISIDATNRFFSLMIAQVNLQIANKNLENNEAIYQIAEGRYNLGKIAENELLQLQLNVMNSRQDVAQASLNLETSALRLKSYIGIAGEKNIELVLPEDIPEFEVNEEVALKQAWDNRSDAVAFKRRLLEADRGVARARGEAGLDARIEASFGLSNRALELNDVLRNPENSQFIRIGFDIPVLDWGRTKSRIRTAEAYQRLIEFDVQQEKVNFEEQVFTQVKLFKMYRDQIDIAKISSDIGQRSYEISYNRFNIGKISIIELNDALEKKDAAQRSYITALRDFWEAYYELRLQTLYDFQTDQVLFSKE